VTLLSGTYRSGSASSLGAQDSASYQVDASFGRTSWYGRIYNVPNEIRSLTVTYRGSNTAACTQTVALWNWTTGVWSTWDSRTVSTATTVTLPIGGTLANFVSGTSGPGDVAVRISCARTDSSAFTNSGDLMTIAYGT
jgi:hypothetical protein